MNTHLLMTIVLDPVQIEVTKIDFDRDMVRQGLASPLPLRIEVVLSESARQDIEKTVIAHVLGDV